MIRMVDAHDNLRACSPLNREIRWEATGGEIRINLIYRTDDRGAASELTGKSGNALFPDDPVASGKRNAATNRASVTAARRRLAVAQIQ
jgi:hypothetical protein